MYPEVAAMRGNKNIDKYQWNSHQFLFTKKKTKKPFKFTKLIFENEIEFKSLIMYKKGWKLNFTTPLIHPSVDGYLKLIVQID